MITIDLSDSEHLSTVFSPSDLEIILESVAAIPNANAISIWQFVRTIQKLSPEGAAVIIDHFCYAGRINERKKMAKFNAFNGASYEN
jgi:predicted membrane protein